MTRAVRIFGLSSALLLCFTSASRSQFRVLAWNAGGGAAGAFGADGNAAGGTVATYPRTIDRTGIVMPAPEAVYQSERWGSFTYTVNGLQPAGNYTVRLHFAEVVFTAPNQRKFNLDINGTRVLADFDIVAAAGAPNRAVIREFVIPANAAGQFVLDFRPGSIDAPKLSGLEIMESAPVRVLGINAGGAAAGGYLKDTGFSGGTAATSTNSIDTGDVADPAPMAVYQSERWGDHSYTITSLAPQAAYIVRLHFAEFFFTGPGMRKFNVAVNNQTVLTDYDIAAAAGAANRAVIQDIGTTADATGQISVRFMRGAADQAKSSGIEVFAATQGSVPPLDPTGRSLTVTPGREFAANSFVHQPLSPNAPLDPNSSAYVNDLLRQTRNGVPAVNIRAYTPAIFLAGPDQPTVRVKAWDRNNPSWSYPALQDKWAAVPIPDGFVAASGTDQEAVVYQPSTGRMWEFWLMQKTGARVVNSAGQTVDEWGARWGGRMDSIQTNPGYFLTEGGDWNTTGGTKYGTTATSLAFLAGIMTIEEQQRGVIDHAIGVALGDALAYPRWSWPANRTDGAGPSPIPEGTIFRLPASLDLDALPMDPYARMIAKAVQKHGMVVWDKTGANVSFRAENPANKYPEGDPYTKVGGILNCPGGTSQPACWADANGRLKGFPWDKLQALQTTMN